MILNVTNGGFAIIVAASVMKGGKVPHAKP